MTTPDVTMHALNPLSADTTVDDFLGGKVKVRQPAKGYRAGIDAVFLAASVKAPGECDEPLRILDCGAGVGTVGLAIAARIENARVTMVERDPALAALARRNIEANGFQHRMSVIEADLTAHGIDWRKAGLVEGAYSHVVANPPYHSDAAGTRSPLPVKANSHAARGDALERWVRFMTRMAAPGGRFAMVHKPDVLEDLLPLLRNRFGGLAILPLHPRHAEPAVRIVVCGTKGSRAPMRIHFGFVLHGAGNAFTDEASQILRQAAPLSIHS